ncbi:hypothetical protein D3C86_1735890 [compost metagenome]
MALVRQQRRDSHDVLRLRSLGRVCFNGPGCGHDNVLVPVPGSQFRGGMGARANDPGRRSQRLGLKIRMVRQRHVGQDPDPCSFTCGACDLLRRPTRHQAVGNRCCGAVEHVSEALPVRGAPNRPVAVDRYCFNFDAQGGQVLGELGVVLVAAGAVPDVRRDQEADVHLLDRVYLTGSSSE